MDHESDYQYLHNVVHLIVQIVLTQRHMILMQEKNLQMKH